MSKDKDLPPRIRAVMDQHIGKNHDKQPVSRKLEMLRLRKRRYVFITLINVLALVFFGYWFFSGMTELSSWVFYLLAAVFVLNVISVRYQKRNIESAEEFLRQH